MSLVINTNVSSLNASASVSKTNSRLEVTLQRLSTGYKINTAADNAAGLAISVAMTAQINGSNQASQNASDAISFAQTADGAMASITDMMQTMRQLAVQAANGTYTSADRTNIQTEFKALQEEIKRTIQTTTFNGKKILNGSASGIIFQVGAYSSDTVSMTISNLSGVSDIQTAYSSISVGGATGSAARSAISAIDQALTAIATSRANVGSIQNRFTNVINNLTITSTNLSAARSRIIDVDFASETAQLAKLQVLQQSGIAMLSQANAVPQAVLGLLR